MCPTPGSAGLASVAADTGFVARTEPEIVMPKNTKNPTTTEPRTSRLDLLAALLGRTEGATIEDMTQATGWQAHSVRGAMAGALKKRGHSIVSTKTDGLRTYRIASA